MKEAMMNEFPNRLKSVLAEHRRTNRWLAQQMGKGETTVSRWCSNRKQPSVIQLQVIARLLDVDVRILLTSTK
jgi:putative transcriptional regulator